MENVAIVLFNVESEGYQAFAKLEQAPVTNRYAVSQFDLVKREGNRLVPCNRGDSGVNTSDDMRRGTLIGSLIGILGGPLGVLFGGAWGATLGMAADAADAVQNESMIEVAARKILDGEVALIALVQEDEDDTAAFDAVFSGLGCAILRYDAADVAVQVDEARLRGHDERQSRASARSDHAEVRVRVAPRPARSDTQVCHADEPIATSPMSQKAQ